MNHPEERQLTPVSLTDRGYPLVSVVMPAYNARPFIEESIASVLSQDYPSIELIVVDDGSSDGTTEAVARWGDRVKVIRQTNAGPAAARNRGIAQAQGEFLAFLDADDVWLPGKISLQVQYLQDHPEVGVVFGDFLHWHAQTDGSFLRPPTPPEPNPHCAIEPAQSGWIYTDLLLDSTICIITAMVRRSVVQTVGGMDEALATGEDYDFWLRVSRQFRVHRSHCPLACYRLHAGGTTKVPRREDNEYKVLLRALSAYGPVGPDHVAVPAGALRARLYKLCFNHGYFHFRKGDPRVAQSAFSKALHHAPLSPKAWVYWGLAVTRGRLPQHGPMT
ncbi:MAG: hypothetical protein A3F78_22320 [Burkholderiales bacterium RIFCSPLOWO2_12_FULL_61_40]|nr:MAG: hypothetical protein A3F78_22320 [Burkholderiales bacterium RIFCSPLOWO2_12_FULL_61_40]